MTLETGYLSSRQVIDQSNGCQASGFATGRAARQISKIGVRRQGHTGMGLKILSQCRYMWVLVSNPNSNKKKYFATKLRLPEVGYRPEYDSPENFRSSLRGGVRAAVPAGVRVESTAVC